MDKAFSFLGMKIKNVKEDALCERHGKYLRTISFINGERVGVSPCPMCDTERQVREHHERIERERRVEAERKAAKAEESLKRACVPASFANKTFDTFVVKTDNQRKCLELSKRFVRGWDKAKAGGYGLFFYGACGTGKSHLAVAALKALIRERGISGFYTRTADIVRAVRDTWSSRDKSESEALRIFVDVDLLVMDEVGIQSGSANELSLLFSVIDQRLSELKPTIFITNLPTSEIRETMGERLADRIKERCVLCKFDGASQRKPISAEVFGE